MNLLNLLDPKLGAYQRLVVKILLLASVIVTAVQGSFPALAWVSGVGGAIHVILGALTASPVGNSEPEAIPVPPAPGGGS